MRSLTILLLFFALIVNTYSSILRIAQEGEARTFDPHFGNDGYSLRVNRVIYSRLLEKDENMKLKLGLAESYKYLSPTVINFKLKKNIKFQNGDLLTSEDVKYSFERMKKSKRITPFLPPIKTIEILGENEFNIVLEKPFAPILDCLAHPALSIVSKKYTEKNNLNLKPMGSGKYRLKEYKRGEYVLLEKNSKEAKYDYIKLKNIPLGMNRTIALETEEVDIAFSIPYRDKEMIEKNDRLKYISRPSYSYTYLGLNQKGVLKDFNIRYAIDLAINKKQLLDIVLNNEGEIATSPIAEGVFGYSKMKTTPFNITKAKEIMKNKKIELTLATLNNDIDLTTAQLIQGYLSNIGILVKIFPLETGSYWKETSEGKYDMFIGNWGAITGDADYGLYPTHHSKGILSGTNRTFFNNPKVDFMLEKARESNNSEERKNIYKNIQKEIVNNKSEIMLFYRNLNVGLTKKQKTFNLYPIPVHDISK